MLRSMTGFGRAVVESDGMLWTIEVQSVNSRFLDVQVRLPRALTGIEFALRKRVGDFVARGKINITVTWEALPGKTAAVVVNRPVADAYIKQLKALRAEYDLAGDVSLETIAGLPDLFSGSLEAGDREAREAELQGALEEALNALNSMGIIKVELAAVEAEAEGYALALADKVKVRIEQLFGDLSLDPQRLAQEAAFLAERADVTEERIRLAAHLGEFDAALKEGGQLGRRFNFLLQEMVRETNTIGSKTGELSVIRRVIKMKEELEKIREQVQNLE